MSRRAFVLASALAACGGSAAPLPATAPESTDFHDGTRLSFPVWRAADGTAQRQGSIIDGARGEECQLVQASDGRRRCLPLSNLYARSFFADAACTQPLASGQEPPTPTARVDLGATACEGTRWEIRETGPLFEGAGFTLTSTGCAATALSARETWYRTGAVLPPETFVAVEESPDLSTARGRLVEMLVRAEDGAWFTSGFYDAHEQVACDAHPTTDGLTRCLPEPRFRSTNPQLGCGGTAPDQEAACPAGKADITVEAAAACSSQLAICDTAGASVDPSRFETLEVRREGAGRLQYESYATVGGARGPTGWLYDTALESQCRFGAEANGQVRCHPQTLLTYFSDAACKQALGVRLVTSTCGSEPTERFIWTGERLYTRGAKLATPPAAVFGKTVNGSTPCARITYLPPTDVDYYALGDEVPAGLVESVTR